MVWKGIELNEVIAPWRIDPTGWIYAALVGLTYLIVFVRKREKAVAAAKVGRKSLLSILPTFVAIFGLVGLFQVFVPPSLISRFLGESSGFLSLVSAASLGAVAAGPPAAAFPIARTLLDSGAWSAAVMAFIASWVLVGVVSIPFEAKIFGTKFALVRNVASFILAIVVGLVGGWLM